MSERKIRTIIERARSIAATCKCPKFLHIPKKNKTKLDSKALRCFFVGYEDKSRGYRLFDPICKTLHLSLDFVFDETLVGYHHLHVEQPKSDEIVSFPKTSTLKSDNQYVTIVENQEKTIDVELQPELDHLPENLHPSNSTEQTSLIGDLLCSSSTAHHEPAEQRRYPIRNCKPNPRYFI